MRLTCTFRYITSALLITLSVTEVCAFTFPWSEKAPDKQFQNKDGNQSITRINGATRTSPTLTVADYGAAYLAEGNIEAAVESYEIALRRFPLNVALINNLGVTKAMIGDYQTSRQMLQRGLELDPSNQVINSNLIRLNTWLKERWGITTRNPSPQREQDNPEPTLAPPPPLWSDSSSIERSNVIFDTKIKNHKDTRSRK